MPEVTEITADPLRGGLLAGVFRFRYLLHAVIFALGFYAPWNAPLHLSGTRVWLVLPELIAAQTSLSVLTAIKAVTVLASVAAVAAAALRTAGTAYLSSEVVHDGSMQGTRILAAGPFRRLRNPLYLGTMLHTLAISILMSVSGAIFALVLIALMQGLLIAGEERFLAARFGAAYTEYRRRVPRLLPALRAQVPTDDLRPRWGQAFLGEIYFWGVAVAFVALSWQYNAIPLLQAAIISLGVSLVARALRPRQS